MGRIMMVWIVRAVSHGVAQKISVDYDHNCDFSRYKTYRWRESQSAHSPEGLRRNQLMRDRIVGFVEEDLAAKHLTRVETDGDLLVDYDVQVSVQPQFTTYTDGMRPGWDCLGWGCYGLGWNSTLSITTTQPIFTGTLVISRLTPPNSNWSSRARVMP